MAKPVYRSIFDQNWIERELNILQPYGRIRLKLFGIEAKAQFTLSSITRKCVLGQEINLS